MNSSSSTATNFAPSELDLLLRRRPHVGRRHHGAEAARGRDRLQAGDAGAHDEHARGGHGAGRGHHHRQRAAVILRRVDHRLVAGEVRLAREHVHRLRPRDARHQFHGEAGDPGLSHRLQRIVIAVGIHDRDDNRSGPVRFQLRLGRPPHVQDDIGILDRGDDRLGDGCPGGGILVVRYQRTGTRAGFNRDLGAERD